MTTEDRIAAAELAIGLLDGEERLSAQERAEHEPAFAREVELWQRNLAPLFGQIGDVPPPSHLRERIVARIDVATIGERPGTRTWRLVGTGGLVGALAASIVAWSLTPTEPLPQPTPSIVAAQPTAILVASLSSATKQAIPASVAVLETSAGTLRLSSAVALPEGRVGQLWRIAAGGDPVSLGLLPPRAGTRLSLDRATIPKAGDTLAISVEPTGGSPTGQPTGPVILSGTLATV